MDPLGAIAGLARLRAGRCLQASSFDRKGGNNDSFPIPPGRTLVLLERSGAGSIARIWCTLLTPDVREVHRHVPPMQNGSVLRDLVLRCFWDGEPVPSVECPLGDFFGVGFSEYRHYASLLTGMTSGGYWCYFPMPFSKGCRIEVENQGDFEVPLFYFHVAHYDGIDVPDDAGRFHACYRQGATEAGRPWTILEAKGRGHFVGTVLSMQQDPDRRDVGYWVPGTQIDAHHGFGFLEGDEQICVDGEGFPPAFHGTGTEDYFNAGWYFSKGTFSAPYHGLTLWDPAHYRASAFRHHLLDPIPFGRSIRVDIEHGGMNDTPRSLYASIGYWYQAEPHAALPPLPPAAERRPVPRRATDDPVPPGAVKI